MTILLLGGNGLLGHNVLQCLLRQGHTVHVVLRHPLLPEAGRFPHYGDRVTVFEGSILDDATLLRAARGCEAVINCAGTTDMSLLRYEDYLAVNRDLCGRLVALMQQTGITRMVHVSTANTIGCGSPDCPADETAPPTPPFCHSYYARSKAGGEQIVLHAAEAHPEWHLVVVNPGFIVGPYDSKPSSGALLLAGYRRRVMLAPGGGKSFVAAVDAAEAVVNALTMGRSGRRYLLTADSLSLRAFYLLQAETCGYRQRVITLPRALLHIAGGIGDLLRRCGVRTQLSTCNVRQLMASEYYDSHRARTDLGLPHTPLAAAIQDFHRTHHI